MAVENDFPDPMDHPLQKALEMIAAHPNAGEDRLIHGLSPDHTTFRLDGKCVLITRNHRELYFLCPAEPGAFLAESVPENPEDLYRKARPSNPESLCNLENEMKEFAKVRPLQEALRTVFISPEAGGERFIHVLSRDQTLSRRIGKCVTIGWCCGIYSLHPIEPGTFLTESLPEDWFLICHPELQSVE